MWRSPVSALRSGRRGREFESPHPDKLTEILEVYILYSKMLEKYYVGHTSDLNRRLKEHNGSHTHFTNSGKPWILIRYFSCSDKSEAIKLEKRIKKRGAGRFMADIENTS